MYDIIVVGAGASGLFFASTLKKGTKALIIEKGTKAGLKILMSGGERCNLSNKNINSDQYFGKQKDKINKFIHGFSYSNIINLLSKNGIESKEEKNGRIILKNEKPVELVNFFLQKIKDNGIDILMGHELQTINKIKDGFSITCSQGIFESKNIVIASGGKSYPQTGANDIARKIADQFGIQTESPQPGLCGLTTKEDLSKITGNSCSGNINLYHKNNLIYRETGDMLFTHRGISGPSIFNTSNAIGDYINQKKISEGYKNFSIGIELDKSLSKSKIGRFFNLEKNKEIILHITGPRSREEAKVTIGGISISELNNKFESKKEKGLYFIGEGVSITGKTGGFNLQRCWTSAYICAQSFGK